MPNYEVDYTFDSEEYGTNALYAENADAADTLTREFVSDTFDQAKNIQIDAVREVQKAA